MRLRIFFLISIFTPFLLAFTLSTQAEHRWAQNKVAIDYNPESCPDTFDIKFLISKAIDETWNTVPTSRLKLELGNETSETTNVTGKIIALCDNLGSPSLLGKGGIVGVSPNDIESGIVYFNVNSDWSSMPDASKVLTVAHELGHAIGFGHSEHEEALMYYTIGAQKNKMSADEVAGMTYLYPRNEVGSSTPYGCGTINTNGPKQVLPFYFFLIIMAMMTMLSKLAMKNKYARN